VESETPLTATIWKFPAPIQDELEIAMPEGTEVLAVQVQHGEPFIWATVLLPDAPPIPRRFHWRGTGHPLGRAAGCAHIGTIQLAAGALVFHLFAEANR
jgi:hypothetical protein